jgi:hypothetical protein
MIPALDISQYQGAWQDRGEPIVMIKMGGGDDGLPESCYFVNRKPAPCGYFQKYIGNYKNEYIHRLIYEATNGDIPKGYHLHHLCDNKICVNPEHLIPVTPKEHILMHGRPKSQAYYDALTHCEKGHELSTTPTGHKRCKTCRYLRNVKWKNNPGVRERNIEVKRAWRTKIRAEGRIPA